MLNSLLEFNNINVDNKLIITTHSPYIINFLSIAIQGKILRDKIENSENSKGALTALNGVVPVISITAASDVAVYQLDEADGSIQELGSYEGIPSDENYLNQSLAEGNVLFDSLLEIEQGL